MHRKLYYLLPLVFVCFILSSCDKSGSKYDYREVFEETWQRVNETYFDPDFNGKDWHTIKQNYEPLIIHAQSDDEFFKLLNQMLFELENSHLGVGPIADVKQAGSPYMFMEGSIGIDVRIVKEQVVITKVSEDSPADQAGLKMGMVITHVDSMAIDSIMKNTLLRPPFNERGKRFFRTEEILRHLFGEPRSTVSLGVISETNQKKQFNILRGERQEQITLGMGMEIFLEAEGRSLTSDIGYFTFNAFQPEGATLILATLEKMKSFKGLIIDLRGNNGGSVEAMLQILGHFTTKRYVGFSARGREDSIDYVIEPVTNSYKGEIVVLIDELSVSGAENMAAILQMQRLAKVVGRRTSGQLLWGDGTMVNEEIILVVPTYQVIYSNGFIPEGNGITPDSLVMLDIEKLKKRVDSQLEAAISILKQKIAADEKN